MGEGVKSVTAYGDTIVVSGVATLDDNTFLNTDTINAIIAIVGA